LKPEHWGSPLVQEKYQEEISVTETSMLYINNNNNNNNKNNNNNNNENYNNKLQIGCHPMAGFIMHVYKYERRG
jgi:hypothetical protein